MGVAVTGFLVFAASQVGTPGPANMVLLATGAAHGFRAALPFVAGVVLGKQLVIWPLGLGLMQLSGQAPMLLAALKWGAAAYIIWLAWRIAGMRLRPTQGQGTVPGFLAGLIVHPLNPKAWVMITAAFTAFTAPGTPAFEATATVAACLFAVQLLFHPLFTLGGAKLAASLAGTPAERYLMWSLAILTVASVLYVII